MARAVAQVLLGALALLLAAVALADAVDFPHFYAYQVSIARDSPSNACSWLPGAVAPWPPPC